MNNAEILQWLVSESIAAETEGRRIAAKTLLETAENLREEIKRRNAANITALDKKQTPWI